MNIEQQIIEQWMAHQTKTSNGIMPTSLVKHLIESWAFHYIPEEELLSYCRSHNMVSGRLIKISAQLVLPKIERITDLEYIRSKRPVYDSLYKSAE